MGTGSATLPPSLFLPLAMSLSAWERHLSALGAQGYVSCRVLRVASQGAAQAPVQELTRVLALNVPRLLQLQHALLRRLTGPANEKMSEQGGSELSVPAFDLVRPLLRLIPTLPPPLLLSFLSD